jgi:flagellar biosynthetic protein FliP
VKTIRRILALVLACVAMAGVSAPALAQGTYGPPFPAIRDGRAVAPDAGMPLIPALNNGEAIGSPSGLNPIDVLSSATRLLPGGQETGGVTGERRGLSSVVSVMLLLTVIALIPSIMLMCTCFVRILIVLGLLRQAIGAQSIPPPQVITALALFMTMLVMQPTVDRIYKEAVVPYQAGQFTDHEQLWNAAKQPIRDFMFDQIERTGNWSSVYMVLNYRGVDTSDPSRLTRADVDMVALIPAFMLSELKTSFLMGFKLYLPFLVIDMVISAILISMSMMMLPPVLISLPFKILLFVLVDGWELVVGGLMSSFGSPVGADRVSMVIDVGRSVGLC